MALSFIVTGTAWKWFLDPGIGLQAVVRSWGWESFTFEWIKDSDMAIYTIVIAASMATLDNLSARSEEDASGAWSGFSDGSSNFSALQFKACLGKLQTGSN